jgi:predicted nucleotide-binding protein (sugar kinase/HSP70/actin superfamily)
MEKDIEEKVRLYKERLRREMGVPGRREHYRAPVERPFTAEERGRVTILFGGLTPTHEILLKGVLEGLGYKAQPLPTPDNVSLNVGKEFCNRGQCNPTYYTVGNLIKFLQGLRKEGVRDIEDRYVFITVGSCGPCRFGMYESEYRKALRDAGFERFRVIIFNQSVDTDDRQFEQGLKVDGRFYFSVIKGIMIGDMINEIKYKMRSYEVIPGSTDKAVAESLDLLYHAFRENRRLFKPLREAKRTLGRVRIDYSRVRPKVRIIGEFWAQTTEGDGNYGLPAWLESEGCEVLVEPVSGWIDYSLWSWTNYLKDRIRARKKVREKIPLINGLVKLGFLGTLFKFYYSFYRLALGNIPSPLPSQEKLATLGGEYYNTRIAGGEGHLEVAKNLISIKEKKAHLVISVKPFGCMPSTQSDGVQSKVMSDFKDGLFIPIETTGDGEVNVKSRIQMKLYEARERAREEFISLSRKMDTSLERVREVAAGNDFASILRLPQKATTTAGNYLLYLRRKRCI